MSRNLFRLALPFLAALVWVSQAAAETPDRFQANHDIQIQAGEKVGDVTCLHCSIYIRGDVTGDVSALAGNIVVEDSGAVRGDAAAILGDIRLTGKSQISGDAAAIAGEVVRGRDAVVNGDVDSLAGTGWLMAVVMVPLAFLAGVVAGIIWLIRRSRRPAPPAYRAARV